MSRSRAVCASRVAVAFVVLALLTAAVPVSAENTEPVADAGGPYVGGEGVPVTLDASASSDVDMDALKYMWDLDGDDLYDTPMSDSPTLEHTWDDEWSGTVKVLVTDGLLNDTATADVTINNTDPQVAHMSDAECEEGGGLEVPPEPIQITDPGVDDEHYFSVTFDPDGPPPTCLPGGAVAPQMVLDDLTWGSFIAWCTMHTNDYDVTDLHLEAHVGMLYNVSVDGDYEQVPAPGLLYDKIFATPIPADTSVPVNIVGEPDGEGHFVVQWELTVDIGGTTRTISSGLIGNDPDFTTTKYPFPDDCGRPYHLINITVHDHDGGVGYTEVRVNVSNVAPTVNAGEDQTADEGDEVAFAGCFTDPGWLDTHTYLWDFGDGTTDNTTLTPAHTYADDGVYEVNLTVVDDDGGTGWDTLQVTVGNVAPSIDGGDDLTVDEGDPIHIGPVDIIDPGMDGFVWTVVANGGPVPCFGKAKPLVVLDELTIGSYTAECRLLTMDYEVTELHLKGHYGTTMTEVDIDGTTHSVSMPYTDFHQVFTPTYPPASVIPLVITGEPNEDDYVVIQWELWAIVDGANVQFTWGLISNTENVSLDKPAIPDECDAPYHGLNFTVTDMDGGFGYHLVKVYVSNVAPTVDAGEDLTVWKGEDATFSGGYDDPGWLDTHTVAWDFDDGSTVEGNLSPVHAFAEGGVYNVTLTVTDDDGGVGSDTIVVTVLETSVDVTVDIPKPVVDEVVTVSVPVSNPGAVAFDVDILVEVDGVELENITGRSIPAGGDTVTVSWTPADAGEHTLKVTVTSGGEALATKETKVTVEEEEEDGPDYVMYAIVAIVIIVLLALVGVFLRRRG